MAGSDHQQGGQTSRGGRSESIDLVAQFVAMAERLHALETESAASKATRATFNENINTLLTQMAGTVEAHGAELAEFRRAISQIARIAQVLEGAFGQAGLVGQVAEMRKDIADYNTRLGELEAKLEAKLTAGSTTRVQPALAPSTASAPAVAKEDTTKDTVIGALVKVILAMSALLAAGAIGSKWSGHADPAPATQAAPAVPGK